MNNQGPDKRALIVLGIVSLLLLAYVAMGVMQGKAHAAEIMECSDEYMPPAITAPDKAAVVTVRLVDDARERAQEAEEYVEERPYQDAGYAVYDGYEYDYSGFPSEAAYNPLYNDNGPSRYMPGYANGHVETYYSSNVLYHNRTGEWEVDDEGFYHDPETGYYIVGVSTQEWYGDRPEGTVIDTGKGKAIVCDNGWTAEPTVDFYTNW